MKLGMVFEGGANRTVFSCGVMDKFLEENIMPDYYIGVSAGMAYGLSYLSGQKGRNLELMEKYMADKRYMGMRHLLNRKESCCITIRSLCLKKYRMSFFRLIMMLWHVFRERLKRQSQIFTQEKQNTWKSRVGKR